jgi:hypothetical protein
MMDLRVGVREIETAVPRRAMKQPPPSNVLSADMLARALGKI